MSDSGRGVGGLILGILIGAGVCVAGYFFLTGEKEESAGMPPAPPPLTVEVEPEEVPEMPMDAEPASLMAADVSPDPLPEMEPEEDVPEDAEANPDRDRAQRIAQAQMRLLSDMVYKPFYAEVDLDADTQAAAAELFADSFGKQQMLQQQAMIAGDRTAADIKIETDALRDELREKLGTVLNEKQLASWEEYDAYSDRVLFEALLDGQLRMLAPELNIESHQTTMAIMAEELALAIDEFEGSSAVYNLDNFNGAQYQGLVAAMDRLQGELSSDQTGHAQGFVNQAKAMFDAMQSQPAAP